MRKITAIYITILVVGIAAITVSNILAIFWKTTYATLTVAIAVPASCFLLSLFWAYLARKQGSLSHFAWVMGGLSLADLTFAVVLFQFVAHS